MALKFKIVTLEVGYHFDDGIDPIDINRKKYKENLNPKQLEELIQEEVGYGNFRIVGTRVIMILRREC